MPVDRVRPLKLECPREGGTQLDYGPTEVDPAQDGVDAAAFFHQAPTTADAKCYTDRDPADSGWRFTDPVSGTKRGADLVSAKLGAVSAHQSLADVIHFLEDGPGDGWPTGSVRVRLGTGPSPLGYVWYTSSAQTKRIVDFAYSYAAESFLPSLRVMRMYAVDGVTVTRTVTDAYTWSGPLLVSTTRAWA